MRERPILFNADMVRAVLNGSKTQTRRIMKVQPSADFSPMNMEFETDFTARWYTPSVVDKQGYLQPAKKQVFGVAIEDEGYTCPFGAVGDRLWVRETWRGVVAINAPEASQELGIARYVPDQEYCREVHYRATHEVDKEPWRPSLHMPRWASRITLEITGVRVERLQDISQADAKAEGCWYGRGGGEPDFAVSPADHFPTLWASIYGEESWQANPWVWVIEFKRVEVE